MRDWSEEAAKVHVRRHHIPDTELKRFFVFTSSCKNNLTRKLMFDKYKELRIRGRSLNPSHLPVNRASLSVLIFFLHVNNPRALEHLMHCSRTFFPALRKAFRQTWLRVQLFTCRYSINKSNALTNVEAESRFPCTSQLMEKKRTLSSCRLAEPSAKRARISPKRRQMPMRQRRKVQRFEPTETKLLDDHSDEDSESCGDSDMEERSEDSQSEGSLKDFIVSDEEDDSESDDEDGNSTNLDDQEKELSSCETTSDSDEYSVYTDED